MFTKQIASILVFQWLIMTTVSSTILEHEFWYICTYTNLHYTSTWTPLIETTLLYMIKAWGNFLNVHILCPNSDATIQWLVKFIVYVYLGIHSFCLPFSFFFKTTSRKTGLQASLIKRRWKEFEIVWFWSGYFEKEGR